MGVGARRRRLFVFHLESANSEAARLGGSFSACSQRMTRHVCQCDCLSGSRYVCLHVPLSVPLSVPLCVSQCVSVCWSVSV